MLQPGDEIDVWEVEARLGSGGMGSVYRCRNRRAHRILAAIKVLDGAFRKHPEAEARFIREAEILFGLDHPSIVKVRNIRTDDEISFLEMEFVEGLSLEDKLQEGPLALGEALHVLEQLADALAYLHERGIRHRDLKPANVLIRPDGRATLVDFGLAVEADHTRITQANTTFGTVSYAPPEWIDPARLDPVRWDLYALGVIAFEVLTGEVAFPVSEVGSARQQAMQVILAKQQSEPLDPGTGAPDDLRALIRSLTEVDPERRPGDAATVRDRLRAILAIVPADAAALPASGSRERPAATWSLPAGAEPPAPAVARVEPLVSTIAPRATRSRALALGVAALGLAAALLATLAAATGAALWAMAPTPAVDRPLAVVWAAPSLDPQLAAAVRVGDAIAEGRLGAPLALPPAPPGEASLSWVVGADCPPERCLCAPPGCAGSCPPSCARGETSVVRTAGADPQQVTIAVPPPTGSLAVALAPGGATEATFRLGDRAVTGAQARFDAIAPGAHDLFVTAGSCSAEAENCAADATCPAGCASLRIEALAPWTGEAAIAVPLPAPAAPAGAPRDPIVRRLLTPRGGRRLITNADFASWLAANPTYLPDAARSSGLADAHYLSGWIGADPPTGTARRPVVNVSHAVAAAYCKGRGGLLAADAEPLTWSEADGVGLEWRLDAGRPAWRQADGAVSRPGTVDPKSSTAFTGFRCAGG